MTNARDRLSGLRLLGGAAAVVIVAAGLRASASVFVPFFVAIFLAILCLPPFKWLQQKGLPPALALCLVICVVVVMAMSFVLVSGSSVSDISSRLPDYAASLDGTKQQLKGWLVSMGLKPTKLFDHESFDSRRAIQLFGTLMGSLGSLMSNMVVILLAFAFLLLEAPTFEAKIAWLAHGEHRDESRLEHIQTQIRRYIAIKTAVSLLTGVLVTIWLSVLGVDYPLLWGMLAFLFNFVPNVGSVIAALPAIVLAFIQYGLGSAIATAVGYLVINAIVGNILEPRMMGQRLGLSTLVVFASLIFWGWVLGPIGMILSVPLTMIVKIVLENSPDLGWVAILLGSEPPQEVTRPSQVA